jgi:hypothetical protein
MSVDHLSDWRKAVAGATDLQEFEELYHEVRNLEVVHSNCNSSKGQKDLFDWWRSQLPRPYVDNDQKLANLRWGVGQVYRLWGIDWLYEVPEGKRLRLVTRLVDVGRADQTENALTHIMAASKLMTTLGGWKAPEVPKPDDDGHGPEPIDVDKDEDE